MFVPISWLKEYANIDCDMKTFSDKMTMSGSKVEEVKEFGNDLSGIIVGKVLSVVKHPDADKLVVCQIDVGQAENIQIVTGATNVTPGVLVPVAMHDSTVSGGKVIKRGKLRGEISNGMMCSIEELGYTTHDYPDADPDGIYLLDKNCELGADIRPILQLCEDVVEFEITSNRADCNSILGIAREAAATFNVPFNAPVVEVKEQGGKNANDFVSIEILNETLCPRYAARVVENVKIAPSPLWLRHRLTTSGVRPINNIVDITNYVMLEYGQPMHAFSIENIAMDDDNKSRKIIVRNAFDGEQITTLDGVLRNLDSSMLVIADREKNLAIAGVMGGENSKITDNSTTILFESANFNGPNIRLVSKKTGLRTDASSKYEKGLDPNLSSVCVNRAAQLVEMLNCGDVLAQIVDNYPVKLERKTIPFKLENINKTLATDFSTEQISKMLAPIDIEISENFAIAPTFRPDMEAEADITEEVARFYGYDKIAPTLATGTPTVGKKTRKQVIEDIIKDTMVSFGMCEALNYSFESPKVFDKLNLAQNDALRRAVTIKNPLGEDFSIMRTTTLNAMLNSLSTNFNRRNEAASLFEISKVYSPKQLPLTELPNEPLMLTIGLFGKTDFFTLKGYIETLFNVFGISGVEYAAQKALNFMHPGRCATITHKEFENVGFFGEVHPQICANYEIETKAYVACVSVEFIVQLANLAKTFEPLPKFPAINRDLSMLVKDEITAKDIEATIKQNGGNLLKNVALFDVYKGKQIEEGFKSMAYTLTFRSEEKTLTDEDVSKVIRKILVGLERNLDAKLREI